MNASEQRDVIMAVLGNSMERINLAGEKLWDTTTIKEADSLLFKAYQDLHRLHVKFSQLDRDIEYVDGRWILDGNSEEGA